MIVAEALDALWTLLAAAGVWLLVGAVAVALLLAVVLLTVHAALCGLWAASRRLVRPGRRPRPSWALRGHTARRYARRPPGYDHAA
ncbi:hypothetical protein [Streptomyces olivaceus]|uniref:hypothetical protein n=1 Tax=Streptomyces olivaceus TaxID=47716 RepID=UPI0004C5DAD8|nr:hypothetical protein [Streptomyces olivaceus]MBZ6102757.1 hypothetical protein [Streptomyces olivaceus]